MYQNHQFQFEKIIKSQIESPIYKILHDSIPLHKSFVISITDKHLNKELREKAMIAKLHNEEFICIASKWQENRIIGKSNSLGKFTIVIDTIPPVFKYNGINNKTIEFTITDKLSGIKEYRGEINGKWILMEYDFKTNTIKHKFENKPNGKNYVLKLNVLDNTKNQDSLSINFLR